MECGFHPCCISSCKEDFMLSQSIIDRFWKHVDQRGPDECWPWLGSCSKKKQGEYFEYGGYGRLGMRHDDGRWAPALAHRISWIIHNEGSIPDKMVIMHTCDNPPCCNPSHLFLGTYSENSRDMVQKGRVSKHGDRCFRKEVQRIVFLDDIRSHASKVRLHGIE